MEARRIVLVGFMASGKTQAGRRLARRLGWRHVDLDREIERRAGCTIEEIFATRGEAGFRTLEAAATPDALRRERSVISTGGGWITHTGLFDRLPAETLTVWLKVSTDEILRRLGRSERQPVRPLLQGPDPRGRIDSLLAAREPLYSRARFVVDTDNRSLEDVVALLERIVRGTAPESSSSDTRTGHGS